MTTEAAPAEAGRLPAARPAPPRRTLVGTGLRAGGSVAAVFIIYYVLPLDGRLSASAAVVLAVALLAFVVLGVVQVKSVVRAAYPALRAAQVLAVLIPVFVVTFAAYYYVVARSDPSSFSSPLTRTDALYFTVTVLSTVGFGDVVATSESTRIAVTTQMVADLFVLGLLVRTAARAVSHSWESKQRDGARPSPAAGDATSSPPAEHR